MLSNAYVLAKFRFDTAENEPAKKVAKFANFPRPATISARTQPRRQSASPRRPRSRGAQAFSKQFAKLAFFLQNFANFWRARSRLYQNEILQENMRSTAFFKLYKICILLHRCNLKIFAKNRFEKTAIFVKFQQKNCKCRKICKILSNFKNFSLRIW